MKPRILIGCECSGRVRDAFAKRGWDAWSCDILPSEMLGQHIQDDVLKHLHDGWDMAIFHPPCTRLCNSGVRWLAERDLWQEMRDGARFFLDCWKSRAFIPKVVCENPIPHCYALDIIGSRYDQIVQPWQFGHGETKATCLRLHGVPKLRPTNIVSGREQRLHRIPPGPDRSGAECDAFSRYWRRLYCYLSRAGATSGIKRQYRRRARRYLKNRNDE